MSLDDGRRTSNLWLLGTTAERGVHRVSVAVDRGRRRLRSAFHAFGDAAGRGAAAFGHLRPTVGVVAFTLLEVVALTTWLSLVRDHRLASAVAAIGVLALVAGVMLESIVNHLTFAGLRVPTPLAGIALLAVTEAALWTGWLVAATRVGSVAAIAGATIVFAALLVPQHTLERDVLAGRGPRLRLDARTLPYSAVEAVAGGVWLAFILHGERILAVLGAFGADGFVRAGVGATALARLAHLVAPDGVESVTLLGLGALAVLLFVEHALAARLRE